MYAIILFQGFPLFLHMKNADAILHGIEEKNKKDVTAEIGFVIKVGLFLNLEFLKNLFNPM